MADSWLEAELEFADKLKAKDNEIDRLNRIIQSFDDDKFEYESEIERLREEKNNLMFDTLKLNHTIDVLSIKLANSLN